MYCIAENLKSSAKGKDPVAQKNISSETQEQAIKIAKATQKPGQTKEQTKLIAKGIEKGIAEYKKQQKAKARERDKLRKKELKSSEPVEDAPLDTNKTPTDKAKVWWLPWCLLALSWAGFLSYLIFMR